MAIVLWLRANWKALLVANALGYGLKALAFALLVWLGLGLLWAGIISGALAWLPLLVGLTSRKG